MAAAQQPKQQQLQLDAVKVADHSDQHSPSSKQPPQAAAAGAGAAAAEPPLCDEGPFATAQRKLSAMPEDEEYVGALGAAGTPGGAAPRRQRRCCFCCFGGGGAAADGAGGADGAAGQGAAGGSGSPGAAAAGGLGRPLGSRLSGGGGFRGSMKKRLSFRGSGFKSMRTLGSHAYSDAEWFDALSKLDSRDLAERASLADVDRMVKEMSAAAWAPHPPLMFGVPNMVFCPFPLDVSRFCGIWARDLDRSTPPPDPIDVLLKVGWMVQKVHSSVLHVQFKETDKEMIMVAKPGFAPPGMPCYTETFSKVAPSETSWVLRRDLRPGRSYGNIFMTTDGTLIFRVCTRPLRGNDVDVWTEEYMRLEDGGNTLVARQCCKHMPSGRTAVQYLVGRRCETPPKGW